MKSEDVGSIPVVTDAAEKRLAGIVTDRDLTLKVLAEGRDPETTRIESVMTANPISCREDQDINEALRAMSEHQVRRIPIVDGQHRLTGIIAQADVARKMHDETVGEVVEHISERRGLMSWRSSGYEPSRPKSAAKGAAVAMGLGAVVMYLLDPNRGSARRAYIRDHASDISRKTRDFVQTAGHEVRSRTESSAAQLTAAGLGGGLALYGLLRKSRFATTAAATAGVALVARSLTNRHRGAV